MIPQYIRLSTAWRGSAALGSQKHGPGWWCQCKSTIKLAGKDQVTLLQQKSQK